ncbi:MAG: endolytic transglycosylase MltG [Pseudomonadota bacterium]
MRRLALLLLVAATAFAGVMWDARQNLLEVWSLKQETLIPVMPGQSIKNVIHAVEREGLIRQGRAGFYAAIYLRLKGLGSAMRAGEYQVKPGITTLRFLQQVTSGRTFFHQVTLIEGWRFSQALKAIQAHPTVRTTLKTNKPAEIMKLLDSPGVPSEGSLLPETYHFARGATDISLLRQMRQSMKNVLAREWERRETNLPYRKPMDALIMASIVEKETGRAAERKEIAGVFVRRLLKKMKLQTDPTVIYGLGERFDGNLRRRDLRRDTPYNTYTRYGLPPTPICLPGQAAIHAALNPEPGNALYFVARGDGSHYFSATLDQHNAAVREFQIKPSKKKKT